MKKAFLLLAIILAVQSMRAQLLPEDNNFAPLFLYVNGPGRIYPDDNEDMLRVAHRYTLEAVPDRGYKFASWQPVDVFIYTTTNFDNGQPILPPVQSIVPTVLQTNIYSANLDFIMQPVAWITPDGSNPNIVEVFGWQANFVPWYEPVPRPQR